MSFISFFSSFTTLYQRLTCFRHERSSWSLNISQGKCNYNTELASVTSSMQVTGGSFVLTDHGTLLREGFSPPTLALPLLSFAILTSTHLITSFWFTFSAWCVCFNSFRREIKASQHYSSLYSGILRSSYNF